MFEAHALGDLVGGLLINQLGEQFVGVGEGGGRTLARGDVAIDGDEVARVDGILQGTLKTRIAGGLLPVEDSQRGQYDGRCSADGGHLLALGRLVAHGLAYPLVLVQVAGTRHAAWQHQQVGIGEVAYLEGLVGADAHAVG